MGGMRRSRQREAIIKALKATRSHPDAEWIYRQVKKEIPDISLGTVYRNLKLLRETGSVRDVCSSGEITHFDSNVEEHYHFRCDVCGMICDLDEKVDASIEDRVARKTGFRVTSHSLEFRGVCLRCQKSNG